MHTAEIATVLANFLCFVAVRYHATRAATAVASVALATAAQLAATLPPVPAPA